MPAIRPKTSEELAVVELDGEAVIYDPRTGDLHHLNPTATIVFSLCDGTATVREMSQELSGAFGIAPEEIESQVRSLLRRFRAAGLLDASSRPRAPADA